MKDSSNSPKESFSNRQAQDTKFRTQKETVYKSISITPKTTLMIFLDTGILRANVCRYIDELQEEGRVKLLKKTFCKASGYRAGYYISSTNK